MSLKTEQLHILLFN